MERPSVPDTIKDAYPAQEAPIRAIYDHHLSRFVLRRPALQQGRKKGDNWQQNLDSVLQEMLREPIPGIARLLDLQVGMDSEEDVGVFELLPGRTLVDLMRVHGPFPSSAWTAISQLLLDASAQAVERDYIELSFDPAMISVWNHESDEIRLGFGAYTFCLDFETTEARWDRWSGELVRLCAYMATGIWIDPKDSVCSRRHRIWSETKSDPSIRDFFKKALSKDPKERFNSIQDFQTAIDKCAEKNGMEVRLSFTEPLRHLPAGDVRIPWMIGEDALPPTFTPDMRAWCPSRPNMIPGVETRKRKRVFAHIFPPREVLAGELLKQVDLAWNVCKSGRPGVLTRLLTNSNAAGCVVITEEIPPGEPLSEKLPGPNGMDVHLALELGRQIDHAVTKAESHQIKMPRLHPSDVYVEAKGEIQLPVLPGTPEESQPKVQVLLRPIHSNYMHGLNAGAYREDEVRQILHKHLRDFVENGYVELMARMIGTKQLNKPNVMAAFRAASMLERCGGPARESLLRDLSEIYEPYRNAPMPTFARLMPEDRRTRLAYQSMALAATVIAGIFLTFTLMSDPDTGDWGGIEQIAGSEIEPKQPETVAEQVLAAEVRQPEPKPVPKPEPIVAKVIPPTNLTPVSAKAALDPPMAAPEPKPAPKKPDPNHLPLTEEEIAEGWQLLFDGESLAGWRPDFWQHRNDLRNWKVEDGAIVCLGIHGFADLITVDTFENFELTFDWRVQKHGSSGFYYRVAENADWLTHGALEYQLLDCSREEILRNSTAGALYGVYRPASNETRVYYRWNQAKIRVVGNHVEHWLNGVKVVEFEVGSEEWQKDVERSKFAEYGGFGATADGHFGLEDHGSKAWYRRIKVRQLDPLVDAPKPEPVEVASIF